MEDSIRKIGAAREALGRIAEAAPTLRGDVDFLMEVVDELARTQERLRAGHVTLMHLARSESLGRGDVEATLRELAAAATAFLGVARSSVWLYDADQTAIQCMELFVSAAGTHERGVELFAKDFPAYFAALKTERAIDAHDAHTDPRTREFSEPYLAPLGIVAMLDAPIRVGGRMIGVTCNEHIGAPRRWTADEVQFASSLADLVALALESGRRRETEEQLRTMVEALESP